MTIIAAVTDGRTAIIAADSRTTSQGLVRRSGPKLARIGERVIGLAGLPAFAYAIHPDDLPDTPDTRVWLLAVMEQITRFAQRHGHGQQMDGVMAQDVVLVTAAPDGLFVMANAVEVKRVEPLSDDLPVVCVCAGEGEALAYGAIIALWRRGLRDPLVLADEAVKAACVMAPGCGLPVQKDAVKADPDAPAEAPLLIHYAPNGGEE